MINLQEDFVEQTISRTQHLKAILKKAGPLMLLSGCDVISQFIRVYLIAQLDDDALASTTITSSITNFIVLPVPLLTAQDAVFISEKYGRIKIAEANRVNEIVADEVEPSENQEIEVSSDDPLTLYSEIGNVVRQGYLLALLVSIPTSAILWGLSPPLIKLFNQSEQTSNFAESYLLPFAFSIPLQYLLIISERFISGVDREMWLIPYRLLTLGVEVGLNFWLIKSYSVAGAAYAQIGKNLFALSSLTAMFVVKSDFRKFNIYKLSLGDTTYIRKILSQGWPMMLSQLLIICNAYVLSIFTSSLGSGRLSVEQVIGQYFGLATVITNYGVAESANRIIAQYFGAKNYNEMYRASKVSLTLNVVIYSLIAISYNLFPQTLASFFMDEAKGPENIHDLIKFNFMIMSIANLASVIQETCRASLMAVNDTFLISTISLLTNLGMALPLAALSTYVFDLDLYGITGSIGLSIIASAVIIAIYWRKHNLTIIERNNDNVTTSNEIIAQCYKNKCRRRIHYEAVEENSVTEEVEELNDDNHQAHFQTSVVHSFWKKKPALNIEPEEEKPESSSYWSGFNPFKYFTG